MRRRCGRRCRGKRSDATGKFSPLARAATAATEAASIFGTIAFRAVSRQTGRLPSPAESCLNRLRRVAAPPPLGAPSSTHKERTVAELGSSREPVVGLAERGDALVLSLAGELDLADAPALREALRRAVERASKRLVVDLTQVTFVDSTILGALVEARSALGGDAFALAAPGLEVRRALEISGLDRHFRVYETVSSALA